MGAYLQYDRNKVHRRYFMLELPYFSFTQGCTGKTLYLDQLSVHGEQAEPNLIFVACFSCEL